MSTSVWRQAAAFGGFGLLAALTAWWAHRPERDDPAVGLSTESPAYSLHQAVLEETGPDGRWRLRVVAREAREAEPNSRDIALEEVRAVYHPGAPDAWQLRARRGRLPPGSHRLALAGDVHLQPAEAGKGAGKGAGAEIRTSTLLVDLDREQASTTAAVDIAFGRHSLQARGMTADMKAGTLRLESDLHGTFQR